MRASTVAMPTDWGEVAQADDDRDVFQAPPVRARETAHEAGEPLMSSETVADVPLTGLSSLDLEPDKKVGIGYLEAVRRVSGE
jgi:hypothetical protein